MAKYCSWCGEPLEPGARYCAECGARVLESVRVTGKGDSDPMRGLDIVGGNPIPASKTTKLDLGTLEALKLRDSLPGDDEPTHAKPSLASAAAAHFGGAKTTSLEIPEVVEAPEIIAVPEVGDACGLAADRGASGAFKVVSVHGAEAHSAVAEQAGSADAADASEADEEVETEASSEALENDAADAIDASESEEACGSEEALVAEAIGAAEGDEPSDAGDAEAAGGEAGVETPKGDAATEDAEPAESDDASGGQPARGTDSECDDAEGDTEADGAKLAEAEAKADADVSKSAPSGEEPSDAAPKPAAVFDFDDEHEAVPVIPREAQAAAAKPGPISFDGTDTLVLPSDAQPKHFGLDRPDLQERKRKRIFIALCCVIAVLVIAACVLAYVRFGGQAGQDASQQQPQTQQQAPAASSEESEKPEAKADDEAAKASTEAEALAREQSTPTEEQIFQTLSSEYSALDGYSNRIVSCVDDFNSWYIARDMNKRQASQATAEKVKSDLEAAKAEIESLKVSSSSPYATDAANLIELYDCQIGRITSLTDAWAVSVQYEVPSEHQDEILAALSANYVGGNNPYLERYDELYPSSKPVLK
ncbi:zinc-ribbon domain-containing protein [uncultured Slackia sp.]|uniref:zinc-ribbon domain-containing protein n=1 Tax=uncultured Slackia sp. TaxID=665903 RepID=UPI0025F47E61|nr:zinc-ribbon domain-containing protein [uncultured Slackia sp.]